MSSSLRNKFASLNEIFETNCPFPLNHVLYLLDSIDLNWIKYWPEWLFLLTNEIDLKDFVDSLQSSFLLFIKGQ